MMRKLDDEGSFDRLLRAAEQASNGDESKKLSLLTRVIVQELVEKLMATRIDPLDLYIPKRRRDSVSSKLPCSVPLPQETPKRTFAETLNSTDFEREEPVMIRNLKKQKIDKEKNTDFEREEPVMIRNPKKQKIDKEKKRRKKRNVHDDGVVADLPEAFKVRIQEENGTDIVLVMEKRITESDLDKGLNRLIIPSGKVRDDEFLNHEEKDFLVQNPKEGIEALTVPPSLKENVTLKLKKWKMGNGYPYVLMERWHASVVLDRDNGLNSGSKVQLWRFRKNQSDLCFALVKVEG